MASTLKFPSFVERNIRERSELISSAGPNLTVRSSAGFAAGDSIYVGALGSETCEKATVEGLSGSTDLTLSSPLTLPHAAFSAVTAVRGDRIRIYRAVNVDDTPPALSAFSVLATRSIAADKPDTYYTDSAGSSGYWYRWTYFNETTMDETELDEFPAVRGDDFAHYASLDAIRRKAGFERAGRLSEYDIDQQRRIAESTINTRLGSYMTVPFVKPVPGIIETATILMAAGLLRNDAYGAQSKAGDTLIAQANELLQSLADGSGSTGDPEIGRSSGISGWPDDEGERMFTTEVIF